MQRALPLVASFFSSWTGGPGPLSSPVADRPHPDTSGAAPLPPSRVPVGIVAGDGSAWRPMASGHLDAMAPATAGAPRFSHGQGQDRGVGLTTHHGYGRSGKEPGPQER